MSMHKIRFDDLFFRIGRIRLTFIGLTQKTSQPLITQCPLCPLWFVFRHLCVSPDLNRLLVL